MCLLKMENLFLTEIKNIVVGVAFPGLANDLNLKDLDMDIDIPETVTITADVKDAIVGTSITMASAELMNEFRTGRHRQL